MSFIKRLAFRNFLAVTFVGLIGFVSASSLEAQTDEIVIDVVTLKITPEAETLIGQIVGGRYSKTGSAKVSIDAYGTATNSKSEIPVASPHFDYNAQAHAATVGEKQINQILALVKATDGCKVVTSHQTRAANNETAVSFKGRHETYCTSYETAKGRHGSSVNRPMHEVIEDGTVVKNRSSLAEGGIQLDSTISINKLTEVSTFTYSASDGNKLTVFLPQCKNHEIKFNSLLKPGSGLLVKSDYILNGKNTFHRVETGVPVVSKIPYVRRVFKNVGMEMVREPDSKTLVLVSARTK